MPFPFPKNTGWIELERRVFGMTQGTACRRQVRLAALETHGLGHRFHAARAGCPEPLNAVDDDDLGGNFLHFQLQSELVYRVRNRRVWIVSFPVQREVVAGKPCLIHDGAAKQNRQRIRERHDLNVPTGELVPASFHRAIATIRSVLLRVLQFAPPGAIRRK